MASVHHAVGWQKLYNNSSDYFNRCHTGNVVGDMARISFTLERGGHVRILLAGGEGKTVPVLHEATMQNGARGIDRYAAQLAAGMYHIT